MITMKIHPDKIREVIGKGGARHIQASTKETGHDHRHRRRRHDDDRVIDLDGRHGEAKRRIEGITADAEVGKIYAGTVLKLLDFGAIVNILPGKDGLLHISEIVNERVKDIKDWPEEGRPAGARKADPGRREGSSAPPVAEGSAGGRGQQHQPDRPERRPGGSRPRPTSSKPVRQYP